MVIVSVQLRILKVGMLASFVYLVYVFYGFEEGLWVSSVGGVFYDVLQVNRLGLTSLWMILVLGVYYFVTSEYPLREGGWLGRFLGVLPFLLIESLLSEFSLRHVVLGVLLYFILYGFISYFFGLSREVKVRR